ncbi:hypothetical protein KEN51_CDS0115 [Pseudomonas phage vB_Pae10145-KEN51]|uniref:PHIKZ253 n=6 Tax=Phikzvirus TaxID=680115 RepID=Q8SCQ9_BPDPK|nr:hypothetical protein [Pseudomonas aeruginosa]NP_803819.1 PHIKZ253 [Pseudomonas phage phiKZ]YP_009619614.1 hypothetical protein FDJ06_gp074 [Pseudomonas phage SL2]ANM45064.1 hypothetical protein KTN4_306 [Pseudomonas phage KTN4]QJB22939.1 hypothetical protein fnug_296 [Pseudomonas phage fnug]QOV08151.1 hypothetical protein [Pseudomonas phage vB_PaeM_kmuB]QXN68420.1 hypothetical protein [Pseudomonas phage PA7]QYV99034.1 hypothetical protein [Pseudomonas phage T2P]QYV99462.1 hypothetical pr
MITRIILIVAWVWVISLMGMITYVLYDTYQFRKKLEMPVVEWEDKAKDTPVKKCPDEVLFAEDPKDGKLKMGCPESYKK